jgi:actin, other eukaryote
LIGLDYPGVHELIYGSITKKCSKKIQNNLFSNILLSGGSTLFDGMEKRIEKELNILVPSNKVKCYAPMDRNFFSWIGGSILSVLPNFKKFQISKEEYAEFGKDIVHKVKKI